MSERIIRGNPASETTIATLRQLVALRGEIQAAKLLGVHPQTLARSLAGLPLYAHTAELVAERARVFHNSMARLRADVEAVAGKRTKRGVVDQACAWLLDAGFVIDDEDPGCDR